MNSPGRGTLNLPPELYQRLPFPVAFHAHLCRTKSAGLSPESGAKYLFRAVEGFVRHLTLIAVSDYLQNGAFDSTVNPLLWRRVCRERLSLGLWVE